jgi:hypothetical protein
MQNLSFTAHEDRNTGDWVVRVAYGDNYISIAAANGEQEASLIVRSLNTICSDPTCVDSLIEGLWMEYMSFCDAEPSK